MLIKAKINLEGHYVEGVATCSVPQNREILIRVSGLQLGKVQLDGQKIAPEISGDCLVIRPDGKRRDLSIGFRRVTGIEKPATDPSHMTGDFISEKGVMLSSRWCPTFVGIACYSLSVLLPGKMVAVSESDSVKVETRGDGRLYTFSFPYPREGISLVAGPYKIKTEKFNDIEIRTCFFQEDQDLAEDYIEKSKGYIKLYSDLLGPYPFKAFSIVENAAPTGYGFPSYTLLGAKILRLPFIVDTSLGHEILHNWMGNSVYINCSQGNWAEGLTTYLADQFFREKNGKGPQFRHSSILEYQSYVHADNRMSLEDFRSGINRAARAVGYSKGAMLFHMLRRLVTDDVFYKSLREMVTEYRFKPASWTDIEKIFEKNYGKDLSWFFNQWLKRTDCPLITIVGDPLLQHMPGGKTGIKITVAQKADKPYRLTIPILIETGNEDIHKTILLDSKQKTFHIEVTGTPSAVVLDPDYDLMRVLSKEEFPPVLSRLYGAKNKFYVIDPDSEDIYSSFANSLEQWGLKPLPSSISRKEALSKGSVLILGDPWDKGGSSSPLPLAGEGVVINTMENPYCPGQVIVNLHASSWKELMPLRYKLRHYGGHSRLEFREGRLLKKDKTDFQRGIKKMVIPEIMGIETSQLSTISTIIQAVASKKVIFAGEQHDRYSNHLVQLSIIKRLSEKGIKVAVGMEMFQRPFQEIIDNYLSGQTGEETFLKKTEYFKRWGYDYHLYRPIIQYCKKERIPIVALNLPTEISKKVARKGLDSLTEEQKEQIPKDMDLSNEDYKTWLKSIFSEHSQESIQDFKYFYQAQVLWDETMAETITKYLKDHPDYSMVVIAGAGHMAYGYGIPSRVKRRGGYSYSIILCSGGETVDPSMSDFLLFPQNVPAPFSAKLGVILGEKEGRVTVKGVFPGTPARRAGIRRKDVILELDGRPVHSISDVKVILALKEKGDTVTVKLLRIRRFAPDKTMELKVGPFKSKKPAFSHHR